MLVTSTLRSGSALTVIHRVAGSGKPMRVGLAKIYCTNLKTDSSHRAIAAASLRPSLTRALSFKMLANLTGGMVGGLSKTAAVGSGKGGIPFAIEGTTSDPHFVPELGGVAGSVATGAVNGVAGNVPAVASTPTKAVGGLLGKKH